MQKMVCSYLLFLELPCLPFPANCFSRHSPTRTGPSPTWRAATTLGTGSYNGDWVILAASGLVETARLIASNRVEQDRTKLNRTIVRFGARSPRSCFGSFLGQVCLLLVYVYGCPSPTSSLLFTYLSLSRSVVSFDKTRHPTTYKPRAVALKSNINKNKVKRARAQHRRARDRPSIVLQTDVSSAVSLRLFLFVENCLLPVKKLCFIRYVQF